MANYDDLIMILMARRGSTNASEHRVWGSGNDRASGAPSNFDLLRLSALCHFVPCRTPLTQKLNKNPSKRSRLSSRRVLEFVILSKRPGGTSCLVSGSGDATGAHCDTLNTR